MQLRNFEIDESGKVFIDERIFYPAEGNNSGLIVNRTTGETAVLKEYSTEEEVSRLDQLDTEISSVFSDARLYKSILYPKIYASCKDGQKPDKYYSVTEMPVSVSDKPVLKLEQAVTSSSFTIYARIMAAMNLSEIMCGFEKMAKDTFVSIHPEDIYVNTESGEVFIWVEKCLDVTDPARQKSQFGFSPEWYTREDKALDEYDLRFFLAYAIFRLICGDEPFDGSETLVDLPLLTEDSYRQMNSGKYGFIFAEGSNSVTSYIGGALLSKWRMLPAFIRRDFEFNFTEGMKEREKRSEPDQWLTSVRKLRDCLVYVNGQLKFCDPENVNQVMFMEIGEYKIPVWHNKAVYWYHTNVPYAKTQNGVIAGVSGRDSKYYLSNMSDDTWGVSNNGLTTWVYPGQEVEICTGMTIRLGNERLIIVTDGSGQAAQTVSIDVPGTKDGGVLEDGPGWNN